MYERFLRNPFSQICYYFFTIFHVSPPFHEYLSIIYYECNSKFQNIEKRRNILESTYTAELSIKNPLK